MSAARRVAEIAIELENLGHKPVIPRNIEKYASGVLAMEDPHESMQNKIEGNLIRGYFEEIKKCDAVLTVNEDKNGIKNYIGGNTFLEMGFAHVLGKKNFILNDIPEISYKAEILAMQPIVIGGDLARIK